MEQLAIHAEIDGYRAKGLAATHHDIVQGKQSGFASQRSAITEFGVDHDGVIRLIDEVLTPDSSRFWPADSYEPGHAQPSFDKQPLRDYLDAEKRAGRWDGNYPAPHLPPEVIDATSKRYLDIYRRLTGLSLQAHGAP